MINTMTIILFIHLATLAFIILPANVHAYLDPGTGSFILQIVLAGLFGASFAVRTFWRRVWALFSNRLKRTQTDDQDAQR
ncbi:MAG: hypothetical protein HYT42_01775 [Candidatus Sungbacteria bacterium]|nr:hypothetical protein [Candidatus Sungbacteria bacterium]